MESERTVGAMIVDGLQAKKFRGPSIASILYLVQPEGTQRFSQVFRVLAKYQTIKELDVL